MSKKMLIIKTGSTIAPLLESGEDFEHWFMAASGGPADNYSVCNLHLGEALPDLNQQLGIIVTGSAAYVTDEAAWNFIGADYLRAARQQRIPVLGVCYGHQLLAWTFGGAVDFHQQGREIGTVDITCAKAARQDILFGSLPITFKAQVSHQQSVLELPPDAVHLAGNAFDPNHAFRLDENIWSVQFHPEFNAAIVSAYIEHRAEAIAAEGLDVPGLLAAVAETREARSLLGRFAHYCASR